MKRIGLWLWDKITTGILLVVVIAACAWYSLWDDPMWDDNGGW